MTNFVYNVGIPAANNNPSTDQPDMQTNTNSTNAILNVDHFTFNNNNGGMHQQVQMVSQNTIPPAVNNNPPGLKNGAGTLYTKPLGGPSDLYFTPDQSGNEYQLTRIDAVHFALFGTNTIYDVPNNFRGGWTFLPGNLIFMYGNASVPATATIVTFPFTFPNNIFSVTATRLQQNTGSTWGIDMISTASFRANTSGGSASFNWFAIGN